MVQLTVSLSGLTSESRLLTLPVDVYAPDGAVLACGTASPGSPAHFELPVHLNRVYVMGRLANGSVVQEMAELHHGQVSITLHPSDESPHEWLQWVTPFRSLSHLRSSIQPETPSRRIGKVWMALWSFSDGQWKSEVVQIADRLCDTGMQQFVIDVPRSPHLLQIGGEEVAWRLISLPPGGLVRVAFTRTAAEHGDALKITVGRSQSDNELIMFYLVRGAIADADRLAEAWDVADRMLYEKSYDPVSAAAGAYFLLKNRRLQSRQSWVDNLVNWFPYVADGAIVSAALALQRADSSESEIRSKINMALSRGLPIFAMGATILVETMAAVHRGKGEAKCFHGAYLAAQAYARARCENGAYFTFYGKSPAEPSWISIYGFEGEEANIPSSNNPVKAMVDAPPVCGVGTGKFGRTSVTLPCTPGSQKVTNELLAKSIQSNERGKSNSSMLKVNSAKKVLRFATCWARQEKHVLPSRRQQKAGLEKETISRGQTEKFWRDERLKHSITIFDGNE